MDDAIALPLALLVLAATLGFAVARPRYLHEAAAAVLGALGLLALGAIGWSRAGVALRQLGPTVGFLAALLLIAEGCRRDGLFEAIGAVMARRSRGDARRLLALVFAVASAVTIVLGLDATVVLLTPIVLVTARRLRASPRASLYACAHLANSASLLLPVSNLTNLLAFRASGLSFTRFALLMALPTLAAVAVEWVVISRWFGVAGSSDTSDLDPVDPATVDLETVDLDTLRMAPGGAVGDRRAGERPPSAAARPEASEPALPRFALVVLALTLIGFALSSALAVAPIWIAVAGAVVINLPALRGGRAAASLTVTLARAAEPGFLIFVLALGVIVAAASTHGLATAVRDLLPVGASLPDLILIALISAGLANLVNNLPATLILLPVAAGLGAGPVLAILVGVNVGPNLTQVGSLATLLWRRVLRSQGVELPAGELLRLGLVSVPPALLAATALLWLSLQV